MKSVTRIQFLLAIWCVSLVISCTDLRAAINLKTVASGLSAPVFITSARDGSGRLFILEQAGRIRILSGGSLLGTPFLDITDRVTSGGEMGLLGLVFHPSYASNGRFFINYNRTTSSGFETVIAEYSVSPTNPNLALRDSEKILLNFSQPFTNHKGGMLAFGPDGFLYIATGDGGSQGDPNGNGQNLGTLLAKILRIDVNSAKPFAIPPDNPFAGNPSARGEIWAYGFRNPWRFSFDRQTGRLFAGDVGQNLFEEVDIVTRGGNYGWKTMEGFHCFSPPSGCNTNGLILPIHEYGHDVGDAIIGGYVYRGQSIPSLAGQYVFGDFGSGMLWSLTQLANGQWQKDDLLSSGLLISSLGEDESGELYVLDYGGGDVRLIVGPAGPAIVVTSTSPLPAATVGVSYSQSLSASGGTPPYSWSLASGALPAGLTLSSSGSISGTPTTAGSSSFTARVTDSASASATQAFSLTIAPAPPAPSVTAVVNAASFAPGAPLAPGVIFSLFGTALSNGAGASASSTPLPNRLAGAAVQVNGTPAPLFFASPGQINAQFPVELAESSSASIQVQVQSAAGSVSSQAITVSAGSFSPGIFTWDQNGTGPGAIVHNSSFSRICPPGRSDCAPSSAAAGEVIAIFVTGLGQVSGSMTSGQPAAASAPTVTAPSVTIGGIQADVMFAGLAAGFVGLYQVNAVIPSSVPEGSAVPVALSIGGAASNTVTIAIQGSGQ